MIIEVNERFGELVLTWLEEVGDMKLKCNFCVAAHGAAVKTDQLLLVTYKGRDYLACLNCKEKITGGHSHVKSNDDSSEGHSEGISVSVRGLPEDVGESEN